MTIEQAPLIGTASINEDQSIRIDELPSDFKGATRFTYRVTDPEGASSLASVAVFVGTPSSVFFSQPMLPLVIRRRSMSPILLPTRSC